VTLTFHVDGLQEIANWVMAWTGRAKVIQPAELRSLIIEKLTTALKMHQE
jgi:predicted DNA-binding transcriptional regulator YafY